ncbi:MAG: hypothetical protein ABGZ36_21905, partial [Actinomycetota bacterium]
ERVDLGTAIGQRRTKREVEVEAARVAVAGQDHPTAIGAGDKRVDGGGVTTQRCAPDEDRRCAGGETGQSVTWTLGDGRTLTTTDPGRAWRSGLPMDEYVSHRYAEAGTVRLQLTTTWSARWRLPSGPWRPVAGTVDITSPPQDLEVTTARPQLVSYD